MRAVKIDNFGGPEQLRIKEVPDPIPSDDELLIKVEATALNRADILQRKGFYPPPEGVTDIPGLEFSGTVIGIGKHVKDRNLGDRVCGLLAGGGYAEKVCINHELAMPIHPKYSFEEAAAIPEVFLTAYQALVYLAQIQERDNVLIHAGASGVGTAAIQIAKVLRADKIIITASAGKHSVCISLGAQFTIDYKTEDFAMKVEEITSGRGVDVIIDFLAAPYFQKNINSLDFDGRMIMLALMGGAKVNEINLSNILRKRIKIMGSTLRARSLKYKIQLTKDFFKFAEPHLITGNLKPVIDSIYSWHDVADAHRLMESNKNIGKIVMTID